MRAWDPLEAFLTTFEDLLAAALPVTFGFVTSSYLSNLAAILEQPDGPQASMLQGVCQAPAFHAVWADRITSHYVSLASAYHA